MQSWNMEKPSSTISCITITPHMESSLRIGTQQKAPRRSNRLRLRQLRRFMYCTTWRKSERQELEDFIGAIAVIAFAPLMMILVQIIAAIV